MQGVRGSSPLSSTEEDGLRTATVLFRFRPPACRVVGPECVKHGGRGGIVEPERGTDVVALVHHGAVDEGPEQGLAHGYAAVPRASGELVPQHGDACLGQVRCARVRIRHHEPCARRHGFAGADASPHDRRRQLPRPRRRLPSSPPGRAQRAAQPRHVPPRGTVDRGCGTEPVAVGRGRRGGPGSVADRPRLRWDRRCTPPTPSPSPLASTVACATPPETTHHCCGCGARSSSPRRASSPRPGMRSGGASTQLPLRLGG